MALEECKMQRMIKAWLAAILTLTAHSATVFGQESDASQGQRRTVDKIEDAIRQLRSEPVPKERVGLAKDLADVVWQTVPADIAQSVTDDIAELLGDPNDGVRFWIAGALGHM